MPVRGSFDSFEESDRCASPVELGRLGERGQDGAGPSDLPADLVGMRDGDLENGGGENFGRMRKIPHGDFEMPPFRPGKALAQSLLFSGVEEAR